ncbi:MAG: hypothetical protein ACI4V1_02275, partial [Eubacteriales bacterium]
MEKYILINIAKSDEYGMNRYRVFGKQTVRQKNRGFSRSFVSIRSSISLALSDGPVHPIWTNTKKSIAIRHLVCYNICNRNTKNNAGDKMDDFTSRVNLQKIIDEKELRVLYTPDDPK